MSEPLRGWRVLVGRPAGRATGLIARLAAVGASAQAAPFIDVTPVTDSAQLDALVLDLSDGRADWAVFTSVNAIRAVLSRAQALRIRTPVSASVKVAAVGPATAESLRTAGVPVDLRPGGAGSARALLEVFPTAGRDQLVLVPRSALADEFLPHGLRAKGFQVVCADAYRTVPRSIPESVADDLRSGQFEAVLVASASGVPALAAARPSPGTVVVAIGAPTAAALVAAGLHPVVASTPDDDGVLRALIDQAQHRAASAPEGS